MRCAGAAYGTDIDDAAASALAHRRDCGQRADVRAAKVVGDDPLEGLQPAVKKAYVPGVSGVVHQDVNGAELVARRPDQAPRPLGRAHVGGHAEDRAAPRTQHRHGVVHQRLLQIVDHNAHAFANQAQGDSAPNAARRAGDRRDLAPQFGVARDNPLEHLVVPRRLLHGSLLCCAQPPRHERGAVSPTRARLPPGAAATRPRGR